MPFPFAAAITAGASLLGNYMTNQANLNQAQLSYEKQLELMKYQNRYNSPAKQMKRLRRAGLNPHLVYGSGNVTGNMGGELPKYEPPNQEYDFGFAGASIGQEIERFHDVKMKQAATDKLVEEAELTRSRNRNEALKNLKDAWKLEHDKKLEPYQLEMFEADVQKNWIATNNEIKTGKLRDEEIKNKEWARRLIRAQIGEMAISISEKKFLLKKMEEGIYPNTPGYFKYFYQLGKDLGLSFSELKEIWVAPGIKIKKKHSAKWTDPGYEKNPNYDSTKR